jgi:FAD/FMN-containing dehydrogenase/Fe-S oxidoreductase
MDLERSRIKADLGGLLKGEVLCDDVHLHLYASDASLYQIRPLAVIRPAGVDDVVAAVKYAGENHLPIHPRGAGTSVCGSPLGSGLVLDFSAAMRRVLRVDGNLATVQPGVILANLNRQLAPLRKLFGPDSALRSVTTLGGVLATNASGSHWLKFGTPRDKVRLLEVVLADGQVLQLGPDAPRVAGSPETRLTEQVAELVARRREIIEQHSPRTRVNHAGYPLDDLEGTGGVDLARLIVGSQGTLGIITQAELLLDDVSRHRGVALLFFDRMETAARAALEVLASDALACDLMDRRLLSLAREEQLVFHRLLPAEAEAMLLVEYDATSNDELLSKLNQLIHRIQRRKKLAFHSRFATEVSERNLYWRLARRVIPSLYRLKGTRQAVPFIDEIAVAPEDLPTFLTDAYGIVNQFQVTATVFSHVGQGVVHFYPFLDLGSERDLAIMEPLARRLFERALAVGGTVSGSRGDGISRTWYLRQQYGKLYDVFKEVKRLFDPQNVLNPGQVIDEPASQMTDHLRPMVIAPHWRAEATSEPSEMPEPSEVDAAPAAGTRPQLKLIAPQLDWSPQEMAIAARNCNGCGRCRTTSPDERMCPIFRMVPVEEASPRAKANLIRGLLSGELPAESFSREELKQVADLCVNCHQCRLECPAQVDIPKLMIEAKAQYVSAKGMGLSQWLMTRLDLLYWFGGRFPWLTNWIASQRMARWLLERILGLAQGRKLPRFASGTLIRWAARQNLHRPSRTPRRKVLYFVDAYANWNDVELGKALVKVMQHNGIEVFVPSEQRLAGMSLICDGLTNSARKWARSNVELLADFVRQGYHIVTTEPSAALAIKHEYLSLLTDDDARLVAANTSESCSYLWNLHSVGQLELDFRPLNAQIGYHWPCHLRALDSANPGRQLLDLIPGLNVEHIERGCSGMAGMYGLKIQNYRRSLRAGVGLMTALRRPEIVVGATECSTCKIQMEHGTVKSTVHPIKILALAYGLMPELDNLFARRSDTYLLS